MSNFDKLTMQVHELTLHENKELQLVAKAMKELMPAAMSYIDAVGEDPRYTDQQRGVGIIRAIGVVAASQANAFDLHERAAVVAFMQGFKGDVKNV